MTWPRSVALHASLLLASCRPPALPPAPPRTSAWGTANPSSDSALPSITTMCRDVFAAALADIDAQRIHIDSPTPECAPVLRELVRRPGLVRWHRSERRDQAMKCPGHCGPRRGVLVTLSHDRSGCFHSARRMATGGSFSTLCWEDGTVVTRGPIGAW